MCKPILVAVALFLAACAQPDALPPAPVVVRIAPPVELLDCADQPEPGRIRSQRDVARYVLDLAEAGEDCRSRLGAVRAFVEAPDDAVSRSR